MESGTCIIPPSQKETVVVCKEGKKIKIFGLILNEQIARPWKELIDDAKRRCADLAFKEVCLEILSRARNVLTERQFRRLVAYASEKLQESKETIVIGEVPETVVTTHKKKG